MADKPNLTELSSEELDALEASLTQAFTAKRAEAITVSSVAELADLADAVDAVRSERTQRTELAAQAEALAARVEAAPVELGADEAAPVAEVAAETPEAPAEQVELAPEAEQAPEEAAPAVEETPAPAEAPADESDDKNEAAAPAEAEAPASQEEQTVPESDATPTEVTASAETADVSPSAASVAVGLPQMPESRQPATIVASADIPGISAGTSLPDLAAVAQAFVARRQSFRGKSSTGDGDQIVVASIQGHYDEERVLNSSDPATNARKVQDVASPQAIVAAGGICAPAEPYYGLATLGDVDRPVRGALAAFQADRGSIRFVPPPRLTDLAGSVAITTAEDDAAGYESDGGDTPNKPCLRVTCGDEEVATIQAIHRCLTFGNFGARTFPEMVEAWLELSMVQQARVAETALLDAIQTCSTAVSAGAAYGAARTVYTTLERAVDGYRSRHRISANRTLRVLLPEWIHGVLRSDLTKSQHTTSDFWAVTDAEIDRWFAVRKLAPTFYLDSATGAGQVFGAQPAGALLPYPTTVKAYIYEEGSFLFLDGGTLDLGLVRDSTLNSTNDYQIFAETFEAVACIGVEALALTMTVCADGTAAPHAAAAVC